jgi:hypothetical protein
MRYSDVNLTTARLARIVSATGRPEARMFRHRHLLAVANKWRCWPHRSDLDGYAQHRHVVDSQGK